MVEGVTSQDVQDKETGSQIRELERRVQHSQQLQESLEERLRFERLLSDLSAAFVSLTANQVDKEIVHWLKELVEFLGVDRGAVVEASEDEETYHTTQYYCAPGIQKPPILSSEEMPWYAKELQEGEILVMEHLPEDLPNGLSAAEIVVWEKTKSHVAIPLKVGDRRLGMIGFSSFRQEVSWPGEVLQRLRLLGEIFANALDRKRAEETLRRMELESQRQREELAHVARLATMDELAASLAHEINQPLAAILTNAQAARRFLARDEPDLNEVREALDDIIADDQRAAQVIMRIRALVKKREPKRSRFNLNEVILEIAGLIGSDAAQRKVAISLDLANDLRSILGDHVQLQQVILNLAINGFNAMEGEKSRRELSVRTANSGSNDIIVSMRDCGPGMEEETMKHMFDAFFTTRAEGMGMGLSISRSIIEAHGGRIWATENPDRGLTFHFSLPAINESSR